MTRRSRLHDASTLWLACYVLTLFCVLSFIAFEVLDLDGSDFSTAPRQTGFKFAESEHADLRRVLVVPAGLAVVVALDPSEARVEQPFPQQSTSRPRPPCWRRVRSMLARASLGDVPPAA